MAAAGGGTGGPDDDVEPPPPVQYHMSDDEDDKAFYARADRPRSPTSPVYSRSPTTVPADDGDDVLFDDDDDMDDAAAAAGYSSDDEAWPDYCMCEYEDDEPPPDPAASVRQAEEYAGYALEHYNADPSNAVKYELVEATESSYIFVGYAHVNFVARPRCGGAGKDRLFFAELHRQLDRDTMVPTCLRSLDTEDDRVGGLDDDVAWEDRDRADGACCCFACHGALKHPKDGTCYRAGHRPVGWGTD